MNDLFFIHNVIIGCYFLCEVVSDRNIGYDSQVLLQLITIIYNGFSIYSNMNPYLNTFPQSAYRPLGVIDVFIFTS
jgi:hypothetical protein